MHSSVKLRYLVIGLLAGSIAMLCVRVSYLSAQNKATISALCDWSYDGDTLSEKALCERLQTSTGTTYACSDDIHCRAQD